MTSPNDLQSDLLTLQIVFVHALTRQIPCKFQFPWNFSFSLVWGGDYGHSYFPTWIFVQNA